MPTPRARATTRQRHAEHTVVRAVSVTAATTAGQVTARSPSLNGAVPTWRQRNHSTVTAAPRRSNGKPKRRTAGPILIGTEYSDATPGYTDRPDTSFKPSCHPARASCPDGVNRVDRGLVVPVGSGGRLRGWRRDAGDSPRG